MLPISVCTNLPCAEKNKQSAKSSYSPPPASSIGYWLAKKQKNQKKTGTAYPGSTTKLTSSGCSKWTLRTIQWKRALLLPYAVMGNGRMSIPPILPIGLPIPTNLAPPPLFCISGSVAWNKKRGPNPFTATCSLTTAASQVARGAKSLQMPALAMTRSRTVIPCSLSDETAAAGSVSDLLLIFTRMRLLDGVLETEERL